MHKNSLVVLNSLEAYVMPFNAYRYLNFTIMSFLYQFLIIPYQFIIWKSMSVRSFFSVVSDCEVYTYW